MSYCLVVFIFREVLDVLGCWLKFLFGWDLLYDVMISIGGYFCCWKLVDVSFMGVCLFVIVV